VTLGEEARQVAVSPGRPAERIGRNIDRVAGTLETLHNAVPAGPRWPRAVFEYNRGLGLLRPYERHARRPDWLGSYGHGRDRQRGKGSD